MATPEGVAQDRRHLELMHLAPRVERDSQGQVLKVVYKGRIYNAQSELPDEYIQGRSVRELEGGRGWDRFGYRSLILLDGSIEKLVDANLDAYVQPGEITWGAGARYNGRSHHICYVGGVSREGRIKDTRTAAQKKALAEIVEFYIEKLNPAVKIIGHNQVANKGCPSFWVPRWLDKIGVPKANIALADPYGYAKFLV